MTKFFTSEEVYKDRMAICKECTHYFKLTGQCKKCLCFVKLKNRLAPMACPIKKWNKTTEIETPEDLPKEIIDEILDIWKDLKTGRAKDQAAKKRMIETYNTIFNTNYSPRTNCGSCISTCFDGIKKLYKEYK